MTVPEVEDIVLIKENLPKGRWKIGRITEFIKSRDKKNRSAKVVVGQRKILKRAINLLHPIDVPENKTMMTILIRCQRMYRLEENSINEEIRDGDDQLVNELDIVQESSYP